MRNIGIILAAGLSSRFNSTIPKQLYQINGKDMILFSIEAMKILDKLIIITNSQCYSQIIKIAPKNVSVLINDIPCRLQSIKTGINHIDCNNTINVVIHDAARPFIQEKHIEDLLKSTETSLCSQFYMKLVNGLAKKNENGTYEIVNRDEFIEICTPQIINYPLFNFIFRNYMDGQDRKACEVISILTQFGIRYNLLEGSMKHLRKITTTDDLNFQVPLE